MEDMKRSINIQRLVEPLKGSDGEVADNPFSFGSGYRNGGLPDDIMKMVSPIFGFDYMGAAEFEYGALPAAFNKMAEMAEEGKLESFSVDVETSGDSHAWKDEAQGVCKDTVFVVCSAERKEEVTARIHGYARGEDLTSLRTRESVRLESSIRIRAKGNRPPSHIGWLELDNGYFFSVDEDKWKLFSSLFGVEE